MRAFSAFINDQSLNQQQIAFVRKVIQHVENNGYMEAAELRIRHLTSLSASSVFSMRRRQKALIEAINKVKENATVTA